MRIRNNSAVIAHDGLSRGAQVSGAAVIPKPLPVAKHFLLFRLCQVRDSRKACDEAMVIRDDRRHLRLLEHRLAGQDVIGV